MKRYLILFSLALVLFNSCAQNKTAMMNLETFQETHVGMSEEALVKTYGTPLNIYHRDNGIVIYEYIERFTMGSAQTQIVEARRYYFFIKDGVIVAKQMAIKNQPAYSETEDLVPPGD